MINFYTALKFLFEHNLIYFDDLFDGNCVVCIRRVDSDEVFYEMEDIIRYWESVL
jgi:hypothetical protein